MLAGFILGLLLIGYSPGAHTDGCYGNALLERGVQVQIPNVEHQAGKQLVLQIGEDLDLRMSRLALETKARKLFSDGELILDEPLQIQSASLNSRHVAPGLSLSSDSDASESAPNLIAKVGTAYFSLQATNAALPLAPEKFKPIPIKLAAGTRVSLNDNGRPILSKKSNVYWDIDGSMPQFVLMRSGYYAIEPPPGISTKLLIEDEARVTPGGIINVNVRDPDTAILQATKLQFCVRISGNDYKIEPTSYNIISKDSDQTRIELKIPRSVETGRNLFTPALLTLVSTDGKTNGATTELRVSNPYLAAGLSLIPLVVLILGWRFRAKNWRVLVEVSKGHSGRLSLSNFQVLVWSVIVLFAYIFVWITTGFVLEVANDILGLLGISTVTTAVAKGVAVTKQRDQKGVGPGETVAEPVTAQSNGHTILALSELVSSEGRLDVLRFQMLGFNMFAWIYTLSVVLYTQALPTIPESLFLLLGISNGGYIGGKVAGPRSSVAADLRNEFEKSISTSDLQALQAKLKCAGTGILDAATRQAVRNFQSTNGMPVVDGILTRDLLNRILNQPAKS
jgi:hypothetical protein